MGREEQMICVCGHHSSHHTVWNENLDYCSECVMTMRDFKRRAIHKFVPDNLKYLEQKYELKNRV